MAEEQRPRATELGEKEKEFLKNKTPSTLPTNPSDKGWSAAQIKMKMFEGYLVLFEWIKRLTKEVNSIASRIEQDQTEEFAVFRQEISKMNDRVDNILAQTAVYDEDGNRITETYLKAEDEEYVIPEEDR